MTFTEFLLGDRPYMEEQSRNFHQLDLDDNGLVSLKEFQEVFTRRDEDRRRRQIEAESFFRHFVCVFPFPEAEFRRHTGLSSPRCLAFREASSNKVPFRLQHRTQLETRNETFYSSSVERTSCTRRVKEANLITRVRVLRISVVWSASSTSSECDDTSRPEAE